MATQSQSVIEPPRTSPATNSAAVGLALLVPLLAISTQSYWIDESLTALKASQPTLAGWWQQMVAEKMSDLQMPLYMFYTWGWTRLFGTGEWILRAANLPWFLGGLLAFAFSFQGASRVLAAGVGACSAFAWFYLDEARPYAMQIGVSLLIVASIRQLGEPGLRARQVRWVWVFCSGVGLLAGTSLLGVFWCGAALVSLVTVLERVDAVAAWRVARPAWLALLAWLVCLAAYYAWTMKIGARASAMGTTNLQNALFIGYELLGFSGLGPGRLAIRETGLAAFRAQLLPLAAYGGFAGLLIGIGCASFWRNHRRWLVLVGGIVLGTLVCLLVAGWTLHFRLLGRHCAPAAAVVMLLLMGGAGEVLQRQRFWLKLILCGFFMAASGSCLSARFAERHRKDDYRAAAAQARAALDAGQQVWWSADPHGAMVYGLPVGENSESPGQVFLLLNPTIDFVGALRLPALAICSKPDLYDVYGAVAEYLQRQGWRSATNLAAFTIWQRGHVTSGAPSTE